MIGRDCNKLGRAPRRGAEPFDEEDLVPVVDGAIVEPELVGLRIVDLIRIGEISRVGPSDGIDDAGGDEPAVDGSACEERWILFARVAVRIRSDEELLASAAAPFDRRCGSIGMNCLAGTVV